MTIDLKCGIITNDMERPYQNYAWMNEHYIVQKESTYAMAREAGYNRETIRRWLHKMNIPTRSGSEGCHLARRNFMTLSPKLLEILEGELLGDGCIQMSSNYAACYQHSSKHREYLIWLFAQFASLGLMQTGQIRGYKDKLWHNIGYHCGSRSYPELVAIRRRWYPEGKKIVPKDLKLTPLMCRQWYLGDSHLAHPKHSRPSIILYTYTFSEEGVEYLVGKLGKLGFKATRHADNTIYLWARFVQDFLKWIGPCPISCYDYKWDYSV